MNRAYFRKWLEGFDDDWVKHFESKLDGPLPDFPLCYIGSESAVQAMEFWGLARGHEREALAMVRAERWKRAALRSHNPAQGSASGASEPTTTGQ